MNFNSTLHQSSHGLATRLHDFGTKTKALARKTPPATQVFETQPAAGGNRKGAVFPFALSSHVGGAVASWLARSTAERAIRVRALAGDIVLCSWARLYLYLLPCLHTTTFIFFKYLSSITDGWYKNLGDTVRVSKDARA